jgi:hypothetical protein
LWFLHYAMVQTGLLTKIRRRCGSARNAPELHRRGAGKAAKLGLVRQGSAGATQMLKILVEFLLVGRLRKKPRGVEVQAFRTPVVSLPI